MIGLSLVLDSDSTQTSILSTSSGGFPCLNIWTLTVSTNLESPLQPLIKVLVITFSFSQPYVIRLLHCDIRAMMGLA